jgi:hypothetical protein
MKQKDNSEVLGTLALWIDSEAENKLNEMLKNGKLKKEADHAGNKRKQ